jgi:hypothetical protein
VRWLGANILAWGAAMPVIFAGATSPTDNWSLPAVVLSGTVTGAGAGAVLGLVSGWFLPSLTGASPHNRVFLASGRSRPVDLGDLATNDRDLMLPDGIGVPDSVPAFRE